MAPMPDLLTIYQVRRQLNGRLTAKIRMLSSNISQIAPFLLDILLKDNRRLIILLNPAKSTLVSRLPLLASSILIMITHPKLVTHLPCPTLTLLLQERLDILRKLGGSPGGLMRM